MTSSPTPPEAAARVESVLRHADLSTTEVEAVRALRDHARTSDTYAEEREEVRLAWNRMCQHPALAGPPYDAETRVDRVLAALDQSRATDQADGGELAALIPSIEAALFAPLTEARWATLDDRLRPLVGRLLGEWAGAPEPKAPTECDEEAGCHSPEQEASELCECGAHVVPLAANPRAEDGPAAAIVRDLVDPQASHQAVLDAFAYAARPGVADDPRSMGWWAARAILDLPTAHRCAPPAPEVVSGAEAAVDLPNLRGRFYGAFSDVALIRHGFGLLNVWREPDAPELDRMAATAARVVFELLRKAEGDVASTSPTHSGGEELRS